MKKLLSVLLSAIMVFSVMTPLSALAGIEPISTASAVAINSQISADIKDELAYLKLSPALANAYDSYIVAKAGGNVDKFVTEAEASLNANSKLLVAEKEDALTYATAIVIFNQKGKDITALKGLFENLEDKTVSNPYYYRAIVEACDVIKNTSLAKAYIDEMSKEYTMGSGFNYWGFSCDNTAVYLTTIAPFKEEYSLYVADALKVLATYKTAKGCFSNAEYGTDANADSTALAIMAYSAVGDYDQAYYYYQCLAKNFESKKNNGVMLAPNWTTGVMEENAYATKDALISLPYLDVTKIQHYFIGDTCDVCGYVKTTTAPEEEKKPEQTVIAPAPTTTAKPKVTAKAGKKSFTASWKAVPNVTKYQIKYSTDKNFKKNVKSKKLKKTTVKVKVKNLKKNKKYYVKVRAYSSKTGWSKWSTVKAVKTK